MQVEDIKKFIPQRDPVIMVDRLLSIDADTAVTCFTVRAGNYFMDEDDALSELGLIENIAQSASAFAGYKSIAAGETEPPVGYIAEVKNFRCYRRPGIDEEIQTTVTVWAEIGGVAIITGESSVCGKVVADTQMKIFISQNR